MDSRKLQAKEKKLASELAAGIEFSLDIEWLFGWLEDQFEPDDVFSPQALAAWAESAGYVTGPNSDEDEQRVRY